MRDLNTRVENVDDAAAACGLAVGVIPVERCITLVDAVEAPDRTSLNGIGCHFLVRLRLRLEMDFAVGLDGLNLRIG